MSFNLKSKIVRWFLSEVVGAASRREGLSEVVGAASRREGLSEAEVQNRSTERSRSRSVPQESPKSGQYQCIADLNLYDSPECTRLATQAASGRHLWVTSNHQNSAVEVYLSEDDYPGWVSLSDFDSLQSATVHYQTARFSESEIKKLLAEVIAFTEKAMQQSNYYLWGGTVGPNYDCSGLMQAAFASVGIWLPRDAYQQEGFTQPITIAELTAGDLVFFGTSQKATHVGLYLADGYYIHSSGKNQGRDGIGIDILSEQGDAVSQSYYQQLRGAGRVIKSYEPQRR